MFAFDDDEQGCIYARPEQAKTNTFKLVSSIISINEHCSFSLMFHIQYNQAMTLGFCFPRTEPIYSLIELEYRYMTFYIKSQVYYGPTSNSMNISIVSRKYTLDSQKVTLREGTMSAYLF
jgi:hypothetical protein